MAKKHKGKQPTQKTINVVELYDRNEVVDYCLAWYEKALETSKSARDEQDYEDQIFAASNAFDTADYLSTCSSREFNRVTTAIVNEIHRLEIERLAA